jgi:hypothetical protein
MKFKLVKKEELYVLKEGKLKDLMLKREEEAMGIFDDEEKKKMKAEKKPAPKSGDSDLYIRKKWHPGEPTYKKK